MSEQQDARVMLEKLVNKPITGITIEDEKVTISVGNGFIEFTGEDFELYVELYNQPN
jgi:hypothetical protein